MSEESRAFLRHAFGAFYADATRVHREGGLFQWQYTFARATKNFRSAALRHCARIHLHYVRRLNTPLTGVVAEVDRARFASFLSIGETGTYQLSAAFTRAVDDAEKAADTLRSAQPAPRRRWISFTWLPLPQGGGESAPPIRGAGNECPA